MAAESGLTSAIYIATLIVEALSAISVSLSLIFPSRRLWPPPYQKAWQARWMWGLFTASGLGVIVLGILDWGSYAFAPWMRVGIGAPLWMFGNAFALWAVVILGLSPTFGKEDALIRHGPYCFSRNPQYVGFIAALLGWAVLANSARTLVAALVGAVALILASFAEELWLLETYGAAYEAYRHTTPRFLFLCDIFKQTLL